MAKRGVSRNPGYRAGSHWAVCDSCGFQFRAEELKETWDHRWVCDEDFESRHPQDFLRAKEEKIAVEQPVRPDDTSNVGAAAPIQPAELLANYEDTNSDLDLSGEAGIFRNLYTNADGTIVYTGIDQEVLEITLSTPYVVSSGTITNRVNPPAPVSLVSGSTMSTDGTKLFILRTGTGAVYSYTLPTPFSFTGMVYDTVFQLLDSTDAGSIEYIELGDNDSKLFYLNAEFPAVLRYYSLSTPADLGTATLSPDTFTSPFNISEPTSDVERVSFNSDGSELAWFNGGSAPGTIKRLTMSTAWDITTLEDSGDLVQPPFNEGGRDEVQGMHWDTTNKSLYFTSQTPHIIMQWDLASAGGSGISDPLDFTPDGNNPDSVIAPTTTFYVTPDFSAVAKAGLGKAGKAVTGRSERVIATTSLGTFNPNTL